MCEEETDGPKKCCPANEQLYEYKFPCAIRTCTRALNGPKIACKFVVNKKADFPYCDCIDNTYRNARNECVTIDKCNAVDKGTKMTSIGGRKKCSKHEELKNEVNRCAVNTCERVIEHFGQGCRGVIHPIKPSFCDCSDEYYRDNNGKCVSLADCQKVCCPRNEELKFVINGCAENTCERKRQSFQAFCDPIYPYPIPDHPFCDCVQNTYRNSKHVCVPFGECDDQIKTLN